MADNLYLLKNIHIKGVDQGDRLTTCLIGMLEARSGGKRNDDRGLLFKEIIETYIDKMQSGAPGPDRRNIYNYYNFLGMAIRQSKFSSFPRNKRGGFEIIKDIVLAHCECEITRPDYEIVTEEMKQTSFSLEERAIMHVFNRQHVDESNAHTLAWDYGYKTKFAWKGFKQDYDYWNQVKNQTALEPKSPNGAETKNINKEKKLRQLIPHLLTPEAKKRLEDVANILKANIEENCP